MPGHPPPARPFKKTTAQSLRAWAVVLVCSVAFRDAGDEKGKTISYQHKGPVVGLLLDFAIRHVTQDRKSLDDVMRLLYRQLHRGLTDAEFEQTCKTIAGVPLTRLYEYVYTTRELDCGTYLVYAGQILEAWLGE